uniref:Uncharacterized protein n=1 Tax=Haptolina brevifila TaxID=156173 RepID=A0A7S2N405_9EUKA
MTAAMGLTQYVMAALAAYGAVSLILHGMDFLNVLYKTLLRPGKNLKKAYGEWAVVTGATDGIGKAMAFELARKGSNVLFVGRSAEKLKAVLAECAAKYPNVTLKSAVVDFAALSSASAKSLAEMISGLEVGVLINNVGISYDFPQWYHELTDEEVDRIMTVNMQSVVWMTRAVLPGMRERKRGAVVNMSSASARPPNPLLTVYSSTKGFVENFTKSLALEYASTGISFQCQSPLYVATSIVFPNSKVPVEKRATITTPTAKTYARYAVARIGHDTMTSPYWVHELFMWVSSLLSDKLQGTIILSMHKGIRFHKKNKERMEAKLAALKKTE